MQTLQTYLNLGRKRENRKKFIIKNLKLKTMSNTNNEKKQKDFTSEFVQFIALFTANENQKNIGIQYVFHMDLDELNDHLKVNEHSKISRRIRFSLRVSKAGKAYLKLDSKPNTEQNKY
jgi:hypothetical protein